MNVKEKPKRVPNINAIKNKNNAIKPITNRIDLKWSMVGLNFFSNGTVIQKDV